MKYITLLILLASPLAAQDYALRDSDDAIFWIDLRDMIDARDIEFYDGGVSTYNFTDQSYAWTYSAENGGGVWSGTFMMWEDGTLCITYESGRERCDVFVMSNDRLTLLTEDGQRYPVRELR